MPIITLSTDFGQNDFLVGAFKGQLLSAHPSFNTIVDITHSLYTSNFLYIAYVCNNSFKFFPPNSFHIVLVNLFETNNTEILIIRHNQQIIVGPNNGLLTMILNKKPEEVLAIKLPENAEPTTTNYTWMISKALKEMTMGIPIEHEVADFTIVEKYSIRCAVGENWLEAQIIFIDKFENVILNISNTEFEQIRANRSFKIDVRGVIISELRKNYSDGASGEAIACFNSAGYLELGVIKGSMAGLFGLASIYDQSVPRDSSYFKNTLRIFFE